MSKSNVDLTEKRGSELVTTEEKRVPAPFINYICVPDGVNFESLILSGELLSLLGFKKYEGDNPIVKALYEQDDIGCFYVVEKQGDPQLYVISRQGNDWFSFSGTLEEYLIKFPIEEETI